MVKRLRTLDMEAAKEGGREKIRMKGGDDTAGSVYAVERGFVGGVLTVNGS